LNLFDNDRKIILDNLLYRKSWDIGSSGTLDGINIFNQTVKYLHKTTSLTVKEIIKWFYIENADLIGLTIGKLVSYLDQENKVLYNRKR
jgi:hypothetical protein